MSEPVIRVENLGKRYLLQHQAGGRSRYKALRDVLTDGVKAMGRRVRHPGQRRSRPHREEFWALQDVSFEVQPGEVVGIIGRNGAGKSTLLKILSRITEPTTGRITLRGRVGSLLEVGTGFHPELTGRENIFLNGAILGMGKTEIRRKFDEIVDFAEIERFLDTPVKRYSSGMYVRLAFAVAAHLEPEILLVDEVLAVGDAAFQKKCLGKMGSVVREGRTILFVSHNMQAITSLTQSCFMLSKGHCIFYGPTNEAISKYLAEGEQIASVYQDECLEKYPKIIRIELLTSELHNTHIQGEPLTIKFEIYTPRRISGAALAFQIVDVLDQPIIHLLTLDSEMPMCREPGIFHVVCQIPKFRLYLGKYSLVVHFAEKPGGEKFQTLYNVCPFEVVAYGRYRDYYWQPGTAKYIEDASWEVLKCEKLAC